MLTRYFTTWCFAARAWVLFGVIAPIAWFLILTLPGERRRWSMMRAAVRTFFTLAGLRLQVLGGENLPLDTPFVAVANHASYLDGVAMLAAIPRPASFVVDARFARYRYTLGLMMRRLGVIFVSRDRPDTRHLIEAGTRGRSLVLFPEGRIEPSARLEPFRRGAFVVAAHVGYPVVPIAIRGTRHVLPPNCWRPRRGNLAVRIGRPITAAGTGDRAINELRQATRRAMLDRLETSREASARSRRNGPSAR